MVGKFFENSEFWNILADNLMKLPRNFDFPTVNYNEHKIVSLFEC